MTESVEHSETAPMPETVRDLRHYVDKRAHGICNAMQGRPGLSKEEQIKWVQRAIRIAGEQQEGLVALLALVQERDFEARQAEKAAEKAKINEEFAKIVSESDDDDDDDEEEESSETVEEEGFVLGVEDN